MIQNISKFDKLTFKMLLFFKRKVPHTKSIIELNVRYNFCIHTGSIKPKFQDISPIPYRVFANQIKYKATLPIRYKPIIVVFNATNGVRMLTQHSRGTIINQKLAYFSLSWRWIWIFG